MIPDEALVDTNVLLRFSDPRDPLHELARKAIDLARQDFTLRVTQQNLIEAWNVMTRPQGRNGFGQSPAAARAHLDLIEKLFPHCPEPAGTYERWLDLVTRFQVSGVQVHDAHIVAVMVGHGMSTILTFNADDFERYRPLSIDVLDPRKV